MPRTAPAAAMRATSARVSPSRTTSCEKVTSSRCTVVGRSPTSRSMRQHRHTCGSRRHEYQREPCRLRRRHGEQVNTVPEENVGLLAVEALVRERRRGLEWRKASPRLAQARCDGDLSGAERARDPRARTAPPPCRHTGSARVVDRGFARRARARQRRSRPRRSGARRTRRGSARACRSGGRAIPSAVTAATMPSADSEANSVPESAADPCCHSCGRARMRSAMMLRWICCVPP